MSISNAELICVLRMHVYVFACVGAHVHMCEDVQSKADV